MTRTRWTVTRPTRCHPEEYGRAIPPKFLRAMATARRDVMYEEPRLTSIHRHARRLRPDRHPALRRGSEFLAARLPETVRLITFKANGSVLVHDDAGGYKPLDCIRK